QYVRSGASSVSVNVSPMFRLLSGVLHPNGIAHNLELIYISNSSGDPAQKKWIWNGNPSLNAISVSRTLALHNNVTDISTFSAFYDNTSIGDIDTRTCPPGCLYNIVEARLTLWRL
ncbi:MAG: hypothetical protein QXO51_07485, partial [Halobacteria archaeon]